MSTPDYYKHDGIETIDYLHAFLTPEEYKGFCKANIIKYLSREHEKMSNIDIRKASDYMRYLMEEIEREEAE